MHVMARQSSGVTDAVDSVEGLDSGKVSTQQKHCLGVRETSLSMHASAWWSCQISIDHSASPFQRMLSEVHKTPKRLLV